MAISSVDGLNQCALPDEHLIDVQEDVAALNNHSLDGQILSNVLGLTHLVEQWWQWNSLKYFGYFFGLSSPVRFLWVQCGFDAVVINIQNVTCTPDSDTYLLRHAFVWKGLLAAFWHVLEISSPHGREGCVPATRAMLWCNEVSVRRHRHTLLTYRRLNTEYCIRILCLSRLAASLGVIVI